VIPHPFGVIGLAINTAAAIGLLFATRTPYAGSPLTEEQIRSLWPVMPGERRRYALTVWGYRLSIGALIVGFLLQLADLLQG
jgi:hypothetical protein